MNCLFVNLHEPVVNSGGIETVTGILSAEFSDSYSINTYCLWQLSGSKDAKRYTFKESKSLSNLSVNDIAVLLMEWDINIIIVQAYNEYVPVMRDAIDSSNLNIKLIYVLHSNPGWEFMISKWSNVRRFPKRQGLRGLIKVLGYPLFRYYHNKKTKNTYIMNYELCDKIILLSSNFITEYLEIIEKNDSSKIRVVPNPCKYNNKSCEIRKYKKSKTVLIVSRLVEFPKRISIALNIWKHIELDECYNDWRLIIVGDGEDFAKYKEIIFQNSLKHVSLVGRRDPLQYYKDSAIFMMTSVHEGFGLTIVEAQNYGCVPIVFNSFSSVSDIITNRINGIIIPNNNITMYIAELKRIMKDVGCREIMSNNAIESAISFNIETIGRNWINILTE